MSKKNGLGKFVLGAAVGAGLGVLFAPKKGSETRAELKVKLNELAEKAKNMKANDVKIYIEDKIDEIKVSLEELDKEKVLEFAKEKAAQINKKTDELVKYVVEKGTPVMEKTATAIKEKASLVIKDVLKRLEKEDKTAEKTADAVDSQE